MSDKVTKISIIGGYGKMGRWLARFLAKEGLQVTIAGRSLQKLEEAARELGCRAAPLEEAVKQAQVIIISVPIGSLEDVVREIAPHTRPGQYVFDIASVKQRPVEIMHKYLSGCRILGTHPMFGPGAESLQGQRFVFTPVGDEEGSLAEQLRRQLESRGARVTIMSPPEHDKLMGMVLGLPHFIALVSADTLLSLNSLKEAGEVSGTSFHLLLTLAEAVLSEDPDFYSSLQMSLPDMAVIEELFREKTGYWLNLVREHDGEHFAQRMRYLREQFEREDPDFSAAYRNLYRLAD
ncbi:MAG: prephenate dehydrogenase [Dehalococcoidia bacterium]